MARNKARWFPVNDGTPYKTKKGSFTSGKTKGGDCITSPLKKALCKSRGYKHPQYQRIDEIFPHANE